MLPYSTKAHESRKKLGVSSRLIARESYFEGTQKFIPLGMIVKLSSLGALSITSTNERRIPTTIITFDKHGESYKILLLSIL